MARPNKDGIDYFPLDVKFDDEVYIIISKFGPTGLGVLVILWQIIYNNGYYSPWSERELLLYRSRFNADAELINTIVMECVEWGIFNKQLYEKYEILTSKGIQKRFIEATARRKEVAFIKEYLLINFNDKSFERYIKKVNVVINSIKDSNNEVNDNNNSQTDIETDIDTENETENETDEKPKEPSKPKKKTELSKEQMALFTKFWEVWPKKVSRGQAEITWSKINPDEKFTDEIIEGVKRAIKNDSRFEEGYTPHASTWLNAKGWLDVFDGSEKKPKKPVPNNKFINYEQKDYDYEKIQRKAIEAIVKEGKSDA